MLRKAVNYHKNQKGQKSHAIVAFFTVAGQSLLQHGGLYVTASVHTNSDSQHITCVVTDPTLRRRGQMHIYVILQNTTYSVRWDGSHIAYFSHSFRQ